MEGLSPSKPKDDDDALVLEHSVSDLHALKKLYGLLQQSCPKTSLDHHQDSLDEKSRHMFKKLLDGATQQVLECQAKIVSCALDPPTPPPIKEPIEETKPKSLPDIIQKSTSFSDKLHQYPSIVHCKKHASSNPLLDATTQQFHESQAEIVSSALEFPPSLLENPVFPSPALKNPVVELVPESIPNGIQSKIRLWECQSNVQREKQASVDLPIDAATQQFLQCQAKEHVRLSMLKEPGGEHTEKLQDCHSIAQHEKLASCSLSVDAASQQCHAKHQLVSSALKPPPLSLEDHCQLSSSDESGGESRPEHAFNSTERSTRSSEKLPEFHSVVQCKDHPACNPSVDVAPQKVYQCQAKTVSSAMLPPQNSPLEEHVQIRSLKEPGGNHGPEPHDLIEKRAKSSEKLQECHSIVQQEKHASCGQCQTKIVSSAMLPPQTPPIASLKEPRGNHRPEPHDLIEKCSKSSEKLQECHSVVQQEKHASCGQCQTKHRIGSSTVEPQSANSSEKLQECHSVVQCNKNASCHPSANVAPQRVHQCQAKVVTSALEPPPTLSLEEPLRPVPLKKPGGELRSDSLSESIQKSAKPSEKLGNCHSIDRRENCKPLVDAATQQFLHCQAMNVASAPEPPLLPPLEESVQAVPLKEPGEEHRSEPSEPIQKSTRSSEKLRRSHSLVQREKHSSFTPEAQPTAATKLNVVAKQKTDHRSCGDHERTELECQKSQRSTSTDSRIHHAHDPDSPSRTNSGRTQQSPQHPRAHAAPRTVTTIGHPSDVAAPVKQKLIRDDSSELSDKAVGKADRHPAQRKSSRLAEGGIAVRHSPARPTQLHRTESRKSDWSRSTILPDQKVDNELSDDSRLRHKEHAGPSSRNRHIVPAKPQSHRRDASPGLHDRSQKGSSRGKHDRSQKGSSRGKRLSLCQSNEGSTGHHAIKNGGSSKTLRRSRPFKPSSSSSLDRSATSTSRSFSSSSSNWVPPPRERPKRVKSLQRRTPMRAHKRSPSPETPKRRRSPEKPPHRTSTPHHLALIPAKSSAAKSSSAFLEKKGYLPKKYEKLALVPARKIFVSDKRKSDDKEGSTKISEKLALVHAGKAFVSDIKKVFVSDKKTENPKKSDDKEGRLKRMKNKLAFIFHHHHHLHHHLHPGGSESQAVSNVRRHRWPWELIGQVLHHPTKKKKQVTEAQHGHLHTILDVVLRHIWGRRHQRVAKARSKRLEKSASRGRGKGIHWWRWFRKRGGMKAAGRKKPRLWMGFKNKDKKN